MDQSWWHRISQHLGLQGRVLLTVGLLSSLVAVTLAVASWLLVSGFLTAQRTTSVARSATLHASTVDAGLAGTAPRVPEILDTIATAPTTRILMRYEGQWYGNLSEADRPGLPDQLTALVEGGTAASQRLGQDEGLVLAVGVPLPRSGGSYFEVVSLADLDRTLQLFSVSLVAAVLILILVNTAVGWFASTVALRPIVRLTEVASAAAAGRLDVRMGDDDPDLHQLARSFNRTVETLQRRVAADTRFAGDVSHELRTPLTTMVNSMALVQNRRNELPPAVLEPLDLLADDLERFRHLVVDLIEISRHDSGAAPSLERVAIADLVRQAADTAAGRTVSVVDPAVLGTSMEVDKRRLERVLANLVENAERHGGGCAEVSVELGENGQVRIMVDDHGPGVPPDRRERIFERFTRVTSPQDQGLGVGLGLAIVARHVQAHGGTVVVVDRPGGGARFVVTLPQRRTERP